MRPVQETTLPYWIPELRNIDPVVPDCPICGKPLASRPVNFVNGIAWCRACFALMMKISRMKTALDLQAITIRPSEG